jgi:radical SAM superfamily enzyme YgiQ (UPF0313 family)
MLQASRGRIFHCSYCTQWRLGWRPFNLARVFQSVERLVSHGVTELEFCDDEFFGGRSERYLTRVRDFAAGLVRIAEKYAVRLSLRLFTMPLILARDAPEGDATAEQNRMVRQVLDEFKGAGLERLCIGLESGSATQKRRYARGESLGDTALALATLRQLGLAMPRKAPAAASRTQSLSPSSIGANWSSWSARAANKAIAVPAIARRAQSCRHCGPRRMEA